MRLIDKMNTMDAGDICIVRGVNHRRYEMHDLINESLDDKHQNSIFILSQEEIDILNVEHYGAINEGGSRGVLVIRNASDVVGKGFGSADGKSGGYCLVMTDFIYNLGHIIEFSQCRNYGDGKVIIVLGSFIEEDVT